MHVDQNSLGSVARCAVFPLYSGYTFIRFPHIYSITRKMQYSLTAQFITKQHILYTAISSLRPISHQIQHISCINSLYTVCVSGAPSNRSEYPIKLLDPSIQFTRDSTGLLKLSSSFLFIYLFFDYLLKGLNTVQNNIKIQAKTSVLPWLSSFVN